MAASVLLLMPDPDALRPLIRDLHAAVVDLHARPIPPAWGRLLVLLALLAAGGVGFWQLQAWPPRLAAALLVALAETLLLIATHEACHGTLLGRPRLELALAALISWPMAWPLFTYRLLHRLHHRWNGRDQRDPERIHHQQSGCWRRLVLAGGAGLILRTLQEALRLQAQHPALRRALLLDGIGIVLVQALILLLVIQHGQLLAYALSWLVVERVAGALLQLRGAIEHWQLWQPQPHPLLSQLYGSRTVAVPNWLNGWLGGLPHHSAHHAFPAIATARLPQATARFQAVLQTHGYPPLPCCQGYGEALKQLG
ncbi:MAG: fatty acid desaturase [Vulcanococcus sp.]|uniref:fatty acid desaturase family protein n=1 Tax=Vulcanococcus sp. TaxID=2856995 RepID=UPI0025EF21C4|nr:fatty acid desaturase [Vulcanococcus sp.]MBW0180622.1 fatty acid desaturase [Vulcanococcus sp.]